MIATIHYSHLSMYYRCPHQFKLVYLDGLRRAPGVALCNGTVTHTVGAMDLHFKIQTGGLLALEKITDSARDETVRWWDDVSLQYGKPLLTDDEEDKGIERVKAESIDTSVALATLHHSELAPIIEPCAVEEKWVLDIPGFSMSLAGTTDVIEASGRIRDLKTSNKSPAAETAAKSLQLTMYALRQYSFHQVIPQVGLDFLVKGKAPKVVIQESTRRVEDFHQFLRRLEVFAEALEKEVFPPCDPSSFLCTPKFCGFYGTACKYTGGKNNA